MNQNQENQNEELNLEKEKVTQDETNITDLVKNLEQKIAEKEQEIKDLGDKLLRSFAELDNVRRRSREEIEKTAKFAVTNFVSDLVVVAENFFMANGNAPKEEMNKNALVKNYIEAISMTEKELMKVLEKNQVKRIFPLNEQFDHNLHEAVIQIESEEKGGKIIQVIQAGYSISDRLIRPALVGVAKEVSKIKDEV